MVSERARILLLMVAALSALALFYGLSSYLGLLRSGSALREWVASTGWAGPFLLTGAMVVASVVVVIPNALVAAAGGALFGFPVGLACAVAGQTLGAFIDYAIARGAGRAPLHWALGETATAVEGFWKRHGFWGILSLRLIPLTSFDAMSYAAGAVGVPIRSFAAATIIGMLPQAAAFTALGDVLTGWEGVVFLVTGVAVILMFTLPVLWRNCRKPAEEGRK